MDIRLIAMDLDGTALSKDRYHFTPRMERCLLEAHHRGIAVLPVTGRQFRFLPPAIQQDAPWKSLAVCCNGGQIRRLADGRVLLAHYIPGTELFKLLEVTDGLRIPVEFSAEGVLYLTEESLRLQRLQEAYLDFHLNHILPRYSALTEDLSKLCGKPDFVCEKVNLPYIPDSCRSQVEMMLERISVSWAWSGPKSIEVTDRLATKSSGLKAACSMLDVDLAHVFAIGDSGNDIPMLRTAGFGVAMGNAPAEVQAAADAVTVTNEEDGAAVAIERWVLVTGTLCRD